MLVGSNLDKSSGQILFKNFRKRLPGPGNRATGRVGIIEKNPNVVSVDWLFGGIGRPLQHFKFFLENLFICFF